MNEPRWYAVQTKPRAEASAAAHLWQANIPVFLPRRWATVTHARRTETVLRATITGYVFVNAVEGRFPTIRNTVGVSDLVGIGGTPLVIPPRFMADFRKDYDGDGLLKVKPPDPKAEAPFSVGEAVRVTEGPFASFNGIVERIDGSGHLRVLIDVFARATPVELIADWVESLSPERAEHAKKRRA